MSENLILEIKNRLEKYYHVGKIYRENNYMSFSKYSSIKIDGDKIIFAIMSMEKAFSNIESLFSEIDHHINVKTNIEFDDIIEQVLPHKIQNKQYIHTMGSLNQIKIWCHKNCKNKFYVDNPGMYFYFIDSHDAMLFKLMWG